MLRSELLSTVDLTSMSNVTTPLNITDRAHINAVLSLLVIQNTPIILSDDQLTEKVKNLDYSTEISDQERQQLEKILLELAQLPTGKKLLSILPKGITFTSRGIKSNASFEREKKIIRLNLKSNRFRSGKCADIAHEIRHAIQYKYDPSYTGQTTYDFEKMTELDACLQNFQIEQEYLSVFKDDSEDYKTLQKAYNATYAKYFQYDNYLQNTTTTSPESKARIIKTLYAIDTWYGITNNYWRNHYNDQAIDIRGFSINPSQKHLMISHISSLDRDIKQAYANNMNVGLPAEFFSWQTDCSVIVDGHKLFERKKDEFGCSITMFFANGRPSYHARLDNHGWKQYETYFYEDGLKRSEYQYNAGNYGLRCGEYIKYHDSISQNGQQRIREKGVYKKDSGGIGEVYADDDTGIPIERRTYYNGGTLQSQTILSGADKGKFTNFYSSIYNNVYYRMTVDENIVGQGYFEKYRDDAKNSLEWTGTQTNSLWHGICKRYYLSGNLAEEAQYEMGTKKDTKYYKDAPPDENGNLPIEKTVEVSNDQTKETFFSDDGKKEKEIIYDNQSGWTYQNNFDENGICFEKFRYYYSKNLERHWYCTGDKKGECIVYYDSNEQKIKFKMTADENGIGQGYFEKYRDDEKNSLELVGYQKDGIFHGPYKKYIDGNVCQQGVFENGKIIIQPLPIQENQAAKEQQSSSQDSIKYFPQTEHKNYQNPSTPRTIIPIRNER